jgi:hypothetical protein
MPDIEFIRADIERMLVQVQRQRREIMQLQRAGIPTASAETLLQRMLNKIGDLCAERDMLRR